MIFMTFSLFFFCITLKPGGKVYDSEDKPVSVGIFLRGVDPYIYMDAG
jgi:hypothetical protein